MRILQTKQLKTALRHSEEALYCINLIHEGYTFYEVYWMSPTTKSEHGPFYMRRVDNKVIEIYKDGRFKDIISANAKFYFTKRTGKK